MGSNVPIIIESTNEMIFEMLRLKYHFGFPKSTVQDSASLILLHGLTLKVTQIVAVPHHVLLLMMKP